MNDRQRLVHDFWLEDMTFEAFCFMVEREIGQPVNNKEQLKSFYNSGMSTYAEIVLQTATTKID